MRISLYVACATLLAAAKAYEATNVYERRLRPLDLRPDRETISYLIPRLAAKYKPSDDWNGVKDPRFYILSEIENNDSEMQEIPTHEGRIKRGGLSDGPSLSIVNSLDVLRNRLLLEIARRKQLEGMSRNRNLLSSVGKRAIYGYREEPHRFDNIV